MKKSKLIVMLCAIIIACFFTACGDNVETQKMEAVVIENGGTYLLVAKAVSGTELCSVTLDGVSIVDDNGKEVSPGSLEPAQVVEIEYSGGIAETYPGQIMECLSIRLLGRTDADVLQKVLDAMDDEAGSTAEPDLGQSDERPAEPSQPDSPLTSPANDPIAQEPQLNEDNPIAYEPQLEGDDPIAYEPQLDEDDLIAYEPQLDGASSAAASN